MFDLHGLDTTGLDGLLLLADERQRVLERDAAHRRLVRHLRRRRGA